jgi:hypothetical protein
MDRAGLFVFLGLLAPLALAASPASASGLEFSTYLGGSNSDQARAVAIDHLGNIVLAGHTGSRDFPTQDPLQDRLRSAGAGFVTKLDPTGTSLLFSTYLGGSKGTIATDVAVDAVGNIYVVGMTQAPDFPVANAFQSELSLDPRPFEISGDAYLTKLNPEGTEILFSTYLGGERLDWADAVVVDPASGMAYVVGWTQSEDFPLANAVQSQPAKAFPKANVQDLFVAAIDTVSGELEFATYWGSKGSDETVGLALDAETGSVWIAGRTDDSTSFPQVKPLRRFEGKKRQYLGFLVKIDTIRGEVLTSSLFPPIGSVLRQPRGGVYLSSWVVPQAEHFQDVGNECTGPVLFRVSRSLARLKWECMDEEDRFEVMALDRKNRLVVAAAVRETRRTKQAVQSELAGRFDMFVVLLSKKRHGFKFASYLGGSDHDFVWDIATSPVSDLIVVAGATRSDDFPTALAVQDTKLGTRKKLAAAVAGIRP